MEKFKFLPKDKISQLPKVPGVYAFLARRSLGEGGKKGRNLLYIGKATNLKERIKQHKDVLNLVKHIGYIKTDSEFAEPSAHLTSHPASQGSTIEALILEANLIKKYKPKYNVIWRDDKNYFFVGITKEDFPQVFITHQPAQKLKNDYIGPFIDGTALKATLKILRKVFPYRSCNKIPNRPCLWYQLNRCLAPCLLKSTLGKQIQTAESRMKKESQGNAKNLIKILQGKKKRVLIDLKKEMKKASLIQNFEKAAKIRNQTRALEKVLAHTKIFELQLFQAVNWNQIQKILQNILKTKKAISRIEAYDVSNIQGQEATGSMITFINGKPEKSRYRKFKIRITKEPNDIAMLKEVLTRRLGHPEWGWPDLILIDGGIGQLSAALKIKNKKLKMKNEIMVMSLAKKHNELFIEGRKQPILLKNLPREIFNLILQLRDEAHRFAISYHHKLREIDLRESLC